MFNDQILDSLHDFFSGVDKTNINLRKLLLDPFQVGVVYFKK